MAEKHNRMSIPESGYPALSILASLPPEKFAKLADLLTDFPNSLDFPATVKRLAKELEIGEKPMLMLAGVLMSLNKIRVEKRFTPLELVEHLNDAIQRQAEEHWKAEWLDRWVGIGEKLASLFQPDNLFSIAGKTQELWANRPSTAINLKIITDLRPVYSEDASRTVALVLTNTLIVEYYDDASKDDRCIHLTLDLEDLETLRIELERTQRKNATASGDCTKWRIDLLSLGGT